MKVSNTRTVTNLHTMSYHNVKGSPVRIGLFGIVKGNDVQVCSLPAYLNGGVIPSQRELRGILEGRSVVAGAEEIAHVEEQRKFMESCKQRFMEQTGGGNVDALRHLQNSNYVLSLAVAAYEAERGQAAAVHKAEWLPAALVVFTSYSQLAPVHPTVAAEFSIRKLTNGAIYAVRTRLDALWTGGPYATLEEAERNALAHLRGPELATSAEHQNEHYNIVQHSHVTPMSGPAQFVVIFGKRTASGQAERGALVVTGAMSRDEAIKLADSLERGCVKSPAECSPGEHGLFVDGTCVAEGAMTGHDFNRPQETKAPYFVFDENSQSNVAGPFDTADAADAARHLIHEQRHRARTAVSAPAAHCDNCSAPLKADEVETCRECCHEWNGAHDTAASPKFDKNGTMVKSMALPAAEPAHAAFMGFAIAAGMYTAHGNNPIAALLEALPGDERGHVEVWDAVAPYGVTLAQIYQSQADQPGVFGYEVAEEFGAWFYRTAIESAALPSRDMCLNEIAYQAGQFYALPAAMIRNAIK